MKIKLKCLDVFKPFLLGELKDYREIFYYGGRGSGKTRGVVQILAMRFLMEENASILCLREYKNSTSESVKAEFDEFFEKIGFTDLAVEKGKIQHIERKKNGKQKLVEVQTTKITNGINKNRIIFAGITRQTVRALKSIKGIKYCFIDESDFLGEEEYGILKPTLREEGSQIIACFNPKNEEDYIYQLALTPSPRRYSRLVNWRQNGFLPDVLYQDMLEDFQTKPIHEFEHRWEGKPMRYVEGAIFSEATIKLMTKNGTIYYQKENFAKTIIAIDPATTSKDCSNEYGIVVLGLNKHAQAVVIDDLSQVCTPEEFASIVEEAYFDFDCEYCVAEVNQGGDLIKSTLVVKNPHIKVKEVRALKDKVRRANPVANLASIGKVFLENSNKNKLISQMKRLTNKGFIGKKGESPDRLDAMVWGVYDLLGINEYGTQGTVFKKNMLNAEIKGILSRQNLCFLYIENQTYGAVILDLFEANDYYFNFKQAFKGELINIIEDFKNLEVDTVFANDVGLDEVLIELPCNRIETYQNADVGIYEQAVKITPLLKNFANCYECQESSFNGIKKNWLIYDLLNFEKENEETHSVLVKSFCACILNIRG